MAQGLAIEGMNNGMAGSIRSRAGALGGAFTKTGGHAAEGPLIDFSLFGAGKRNAIMLKFINGSRCMLTKIFDGVLVAEPIRPLYGIIHVPAPIIFAHIAKGCRNPTLGGHGMGTGWKYFGNTCRLKARLSCTKCGTKPCAAGAHHHNIISVVNQLIRIVCHFLSPNKG